MISEGHEMGVRRRSEFFRINDAAGRGDDVNGERPECVEGSLQHVDAALFGDGAETEQDNRGPVVDAPREFHLHRSGFNGQHRGAVDDGQVVSDSPSNARSALT